ncbi:hypothetical protein ACJX0J_033921, partial [Zea mays]
RKKVIISCMIHNNHIVAIQARAHLKGTLLREDITVICATAVQESTFSSFWFWMGLGEEQAQSKKIFHALGRPVHMSCNLILFLSLCFNSKNKEAKGYRHKEEVAYDAAKEISNYLVITRFLFTT